MANLEVSKKVLFSGVWRSQSVNDQLLRQIGNQNTKKKKQLKGNPAVLNLSNERLDILILDDKGMLTRTDQVPLQDIIELTANKYAARSIFAIVRDNVHKQFYIFVFHCASDKDAADIIQGYGRVKQRLSGEGFNTDIKPAGTNWTLQPKLEDEPEIPTNGHVQVIRMKPTPNGDVRILSSDKVDGGTRILTGGTKTTVNAPIISDRESVTDAEMKDELHHLADEIRDIKLMLRKSHGRHNFEKHYQYLIEGNAPVNNKTQVTTTSETTTANVSQPQHYVVVNQRPVENEIKYRLGSTKVQPGSQVQHYRSTKIQPASQVQHYSSSIVQPPSPGHHYRSTTVQAPQIHHYKSTKSTTSSVSSGYTKRTYDSINPALEHNRMYIKNQQPRVVTKHYEQRPASQALFLHSPSDKVTKKIENVYRNRSYRMHAAPSARHSAEYVTVAPQPRSPTIVVQQAEDDKVKEYIEDRTTDSEVQQTVYDPEIRHIYENTDTLNETEIVSEKVVSVSQPAAVVTEEAPSTTVRYEQHTTGDNVVYDGNVIVVKAKTDVYKSTEGNENGADGPTSTTVRYDEYTTGDNVVYGGNVVVVKAKTDVYKSTEGNENGADGPTSTTVRYDAYTTGDNVVYDGNVVVVKAKTDVYKSTEENENGADEHPTIYNNSVYYIKAEGIDDLNEGRNVDVEKTICTDGLWETYVDKPDENAGTETIVREAAYRYHDDDGNEDITDHGFVREEKRVHYMEEIEQTIGDVHGDDEDNNKELEEINGNKVDDDDDYVLDEEDLALFTQEPNLVVIDKD